MPRCIIFCGRPVDPPDLLGLTCQPDDLIIGADSGYLTARRLGFPPSLIIGDFDSAPPPAWRSTPPTRTKPTAS